MRENKFLKQITATAIIILALSILGGCNMAEKFTTEEQGKNYLLQRLNEKYGKEFIIVGDVSFSTEIHTNRLTAEVSPKDNLEQSEWAGVTVTGELSDQYHKYYFKEESETLLKNVCKTKDYIQEYKVELHGASTEKLWNENNSLEEYLSESGSYVEVIAYVENGKSNEEYANLIGDWVKTLYRVEGKIECRVRIKGDKGEHELFFNSLYQIDSSRFTYDRILEEIESSYVEAEVDKEYEEWKKQKNKE